MKIKQKELGFLGLYKIAKDNSQLGDKLKIEVFTDKVRFSQKTNLSLLTTTKAIETTDSVEPFSLLVNTQLFIDFINSLDKEDEIEITEKGISIGKDNHYDFQNFSLEFPNVDSVIDSIEKHKATSTSLVISEVGKLNVIKDFSGKDKLETVGILKGRLLSTNRIVTVYCDTDLIGKSNDNYFLAKQAMDLIKSETEIFFSDKAYFFNINETTCVFNWKEFEVPDLFSEKFYSSFNQTTFVSVEKEKLSKILSRMNLFVKENKHNRIFVTINNDSLLIENRDFNASFEKLELKQKDESLEGIVLILDCLNISSFVNKLKGSEICFYVNPNENRKTLRVEDETNEFKFVHKLLTED